MTYMCAEMLWTDCTTLVSRQHGAVDGVHVGSEKAEKQRRYAMYDEPGRSGDTLHPGTLLY